MADPEASIGRGTRGQLTHGKEGSKLKQLRRYPSLAIGLVLVAVLVGIALYAVIAIPYPEALRLWRGGPGVWEESPRNAHPVWWDWFTRDRLPRTIIISSQDNGEVHVQPLDDARRSVEVALPFRYDYNDFPSELTLFTRVTGGDERTPISVSWETPAGETIDLREDAVPESHRYLISQDRDLRDRLGAASHRGLFTDSQDLGRPLRGDYRLVLKAEVPRDADVEARLVVYGQVHGPFGTDHMRRDLTVALAWGAIEGLRFGILAALAWLAGTLIVAMKGSRRRNRSDPLFQRLTGVNTVLLSLPVLIVIGHFVSPARGVMLSALLILSLLIGVTGLLRVRFLPSTGAPHGEPARKSGNMVAVLLPSFLLLVPAFVLLDAALALFGFSDPLLPSWGTLLDHALQQHAVHHGQCYKLVQPMALLLLTALGFAMAGYALHRIYHPTAGTAE